MGNEGKSTSGSAPVSRQVGGTIPAVVGPAVPVPAVPGLTDAQFEKLRKTILYSTIASGLLTAGLGRTSFKVDVLRYALAVEELLA